MTLEEIQYYIKGAKSFVPVGFSFGVISVIPWPSKPFETEEHYIDFKLGNNLFASEKLSELTLEKFFKHCDVIISPVDVKALLRKGRLIHRGEGYQEWKKKELRNHRLSLIIENES